MNNPWFNYLAVFGAGVILSAVVIMILGPSYRRSKPRIVMDTVLAIVGLLIVYRAFAEPITEFFGW